MIREEASVRMRSYFSIQHIQSAALFGRQSAELEKAYDGSYSDELLTEHRAYVTSSVFTAVSFLEAMINEVFADAGAADGGQLKGHMWVVSNEARPVGRA